MGFVVKATNFDLPPVYFSHEGSNCSIGLDQRGVLLDPKEWKKAAVDLFSLQHEPDGGSAALIHSSEIEISGPKLHEGGRILFQKTFSASWRDMCFLVAVVSDYAFALAKIGMKQITGCSPACMLKSETLSAEVPLFSGTTITVGSHTRDSVLIRSAGVRPSHARIHISHCGELGIEGYLGEVETSVEKDLSIVRLLPGEIVITIRNVLAASQRGPCS